MVLIRSSATIAALVLWLGSVQAVTAQSAPDPIMQRGLTTAGGYYVLADEAPVLEAMKTLQFTKGQADKEVRARTVIDKKIQEKRTFIKNAEKEWHELETRLALVTKPEIHNKMASRMNRLVADAKSAETAVKELEEQAAKCSIAAKTRYVDDLMALRSRADAVAKAYQPLAADATLGSAIDHANVTANPKLTLGPSADLAAAMAELQKWGEEVESESIPLHEDHGVHMVDVLVDGQHLVMGLDTGSSLVSIPGEVAERLKLVPGEKNRVVQLILANGTTIEGREMTLKSVRVGRFALEDVSCVVLQKGLPQAPLLLGSSFLNHFIVKIDAGTKQLHLTELRQQNNGKGRIQH